MTLFAGRSRWSARIAGQRSLSAEITSAVSNRSCTPSSISATAMETSVSFSSYVVHSRPHRLQDRVFCWKRPSMISKRVERASSASK